MSLTLKKIRHNPDGTFDVLLSNENWYINCGPTPESIQANIKEMGDRVTTIELDPMYEGQRRIIDARG